MPTHNDQGDRIGHSGLNSRVADFVDEKERASLFNRKERSVWWLPRKPTLLYMYDVIARSQMLSAKKKWYVRVPSGHWRVIYGYFNLILASIDVYCCLLSISFCGAPFVGTTLWVIQGFFAFDILVKLTSAVPMPAGKLALEPTAIALHHLRSGGIVIDVLCLLPLELLWFTCGDITTRCTDSANTVTSSVDWAVLNWQLTHLVRWAMRVNTCDTFRSVTETRSDGPLQIIKYVFILAIISHAATCILFWGSFSGSGDAFVCDHTTLNALPWAQVSRAVDQHNQLDIFSQILSEHPTGDFRLSPLAVGSPISPATEGHAVELAEDAFNQLYVFYFHAGFALLLGDAFVAKNTPTRIIATVFLLLGNITFAAVLAEVILALQKSTASRDQYAARMQANNETMRSKGVPEHLQRRVHRFYEFMWLVHGAAMNEADLNNPMEWLVELPSALRVDINTEQYRNTIASCALFHSVEPELITVLAQHLKPVIYMPDELVIKEGWVGTPHKCITLTVNAVLRLSF